MIGSRLDVGILGATESVGQSFVAALVDHPWFELAWVAGSDPMAGRRYGDAVSWRLPSPQPPAVAGLELQRCEPRGAPRLVFSGLDAGVAGDVEAAFAAAGHVVVSNARNHRMDDDVPLLVPEINPEHLALLDRQAKGRRWPGRIVAGANGSTVVLAMALAPLRRFGLRSVTVSTLQAVSGAGYPGVASLDIVGNVLPCIQGEEERLESETRKVLGSLKRGTVEPHPVAVSAQATRVPVVHGHTALVSVAFETQPSLDDVRAAFTGFSGRPQAERLPSAPRRPLVYLDEPGRPQPRLDLDREGGMAVLIGHLRRCPVLDCKFVALGHETVRGAAGGAVLNAELLSVDGLMNDRRPKRRPRRRSADSS
ncbi:MAG: aspartate-semialdehyde dehydrogenase [Acidobacteria bacterium]|nr:aspartate-semialdehyde dehydrogenase [Acidobacteriota bacterium]